MPACLIVAAYLLGTTLLGWLWPRPDAGETRHAPLAAHPSPVYARLNTAAGWAATAGTGSVLQ